eukprot:scaffold17605_cov124-Skeletonema_dohrnii-CCMP3373.AAC.2
MFGCGNSDATLDPEPPDWSLHNACKEGKSLAVIKGLLEKSTSATAVQTPDQDGYLPLHHACKQGKCSFEVIKALVKEHPESLKVGTLDGKLPLHLACHDRNQPFEVIEYLIDAYPEGLRMKEKSSGKSPFGWDYEASCGGHFTNFITFLVKEQRDSPKSFRDRIEEEDNLKRDVLQLNRSSTKDIDIEEEEKEEKTGVLRRTITSTLIHCKNYVPLDVLRIGFLDKENLESKGFIQWLNEMVCRRVVVFMLVFEFYFHMAWIYTFVSASYFYFDELSDQSGGWRPTALFVFAAMFLMGEMNQMRQFHSTGSFLHYWLAFWNWIDILTCIMVVLSAVKLQNDDPVDIDVRIIMATGCLQSLSFLSYLKKTFFPFSKFVSGIVKIIWAVLPFVVVSTVTLFTFCFMYFVQDKGKQMEAGELASQPTNLTSSFETVVDAVAGGAEETSSGLDYFFGIIVLVVLLNVVIAVVSEEWEHAVAEANASFWRYRLDLIIEKTRGWSEDSKFRKNIREMGRTDLDNFFINHNSDTVGLTLEDFVTKLVLKSKKDTLKCIILLLKCFVYIVLGFFTCGFFWPLFIRQMLFTPSNPLDHVAESKGSSAAGSELDRETFEREMAEYRKEVSELLSAQNILLEQLLKKES